MAKKKITSAPKKKVSAKQPAVINPLLVGVPVVKGTDPEGKEVLITVVEIAPAKVNKNKLAVYEIIVTKKSAGYTSHGFPGYNANVQKIFDRLCAVNGAPEVEGTFRNSENKPVYICKDVEGFFVVDPSKEFISESFESIEDKEMRGILNRQLGFPVKGSQPLAKPIAA